MLGALSSKSVIARISAIKSLTTLKDEGILSNGTLSIDSLLDCLHHEDEDLRCDAAHVLGALKRKDAVDPLIQSLNDPDEIVRNIAAESLGLIGDASAVDPLIKALLEPESTHFIDEDDFDYDPQWDMQLHATKALGRIGDPKIIDPLLKLLKDEEVYEINETVIWALSRVNNDKSMEILTDLLNEEDPVLRRLVTKSFGDIDHPDAIKALEKALKDKEPDVRSAAAEALAKKDDPIVLDTIISLLKDSDADVRAVAARILSGLDNSETSDKLLPLLDDEQYDVRVRVMEIMGELKETRAEEALLSKINDPDFIHKGIVAAALGEIRSANAVEPLFALALNVEEDFHIRIAAIKAIGMIGGDAAIVALKELVLNVPKEDCMACLISLQSVGGAQAIQALISLLEEQADSVEQSDEPIEPSDESKDAAETKESLSEEDQDNKEQAEMERKRNVIKVLGAMDGDEVLSALGVIVEKGIPVLRREALSSLSLLKEKKIIPQIVTLLESSNRDDRLSGLDSICHIRSAEHGVLDVLIKILSEDEDHFCRVSAAQALGLIGEADLSIEALTKAMDDERVEVRKEAIIALCAIGDKRAFDRLLTALFDYENFAHMRTEIAFALGAIDQDKAEESLIIVMENEEELVNHWIAIEAFKDMLKGNEAQIKAAN